VLVNGMLLGLSARQVAQRFDRIVEFAELEEFIDTPVKFYSSGMFMRLGFSIVIHSDPRILLIDEILAVGDAGFQLKCFDRLRELRDQGAAIVMVSHSMHMIRQLCSRGALIRHGRLQYDGNIEHAIAMHFESMSSDERRSSGLAAEIVECELTARDGGGHHAIYDEPLELQIRVRFHERVEHARLEFAVTSDAGASVAGSSMPLELSSSPFGAGEQIHVALGFRARLGGGNYELAVRIRGSDGRLLGERDRILMFVAGRPCALGAVDLRATIEVDGVDVTDRRTTLMEAQHRLGRRERTASGYR
jgi:hypothetical protein